MTLRASVVIRTRNEAARLRLTLTSLARQDTPVEVVVVNDGSTDETPDVLAEAAPGMNLVALHMPSSVGRSAASTAGAAAAGGDIVIFLDGDTMGAPDLATKHLQKHSERADLIVRGETCHLRSTRSFTDPESGSPRPGEEARVAKMPAAELQRSLVTRQQILENFAQIDSRAQPGIYPGFGPRKMVEIELHALNQEKDCPVLWAASAGSNMSVNRKTFLEAGGIRADIDILEHRELALRLCKRGGVMAPADARSYHLIHRNGWRDPMDDNTWEDLFYDAHPIPEVALLAVMWNSFNEKADMPDAARITTLPDLAAAADRCRGYTTREEVRAAHFDWARAKAGA